MPTNQHQKSRNYFNCVFFYCIGVLSAECLIHSTIRQHIVRVVDTLLLQLVSFALHPAVIGLAIFFSPDRANPAFCFISSQRANTVPFAGHFLFYQSWYIKSLRDGFDLQYSAHAHLHEVRPISLLEHLDRSICCVLQKIREYLLRQGRPYTAISISYLQSFSEPMVNHGLL